MTSRNTVERYRVIQPLSYNLYNQFPVHEYAENGLVKVYATNYLPGYIEIKSQVEHTVQCDTEEDTLFSK